MRTNAIHTFSFATRPVFVPTTVGVSILTPDEGPWAMPPHKGGCPRPTMSGPQGAKTSSHPVVLFTELAHVNAGRSVTNAIEDLASAAWRTLTDPRGRPLAETDPTAIIWLEMYSEALSYHATGPGFHMEWVELEWTGTQYRHPLWSRLLNPPTPPEAPLSARLAQRLAWLGTDILAALETEARTAETVFHEKLRHLALSNHELPAVGEIVS